MDVDSFFACGVEESERSFACTESLFSIEDESKLIAEEAGNITYKSRRTALTASDIFDSDGDTETFTEPEKA